MRPCAASIILIGLVGLAVSLPAEATLVPLKNGQAAVTSFDGFVAHIQLAEASGDWQKPDWKDSNLETSLTKLVEQMRLAVKKEELTLPVTFRDVRARKQVAEGQVVPFANNELVIAKNIKAAHAKRSILLADGNIRVSHAQDCIIIARGAVDISHGRGNLVVAGHFVHTSHDGNPVPDGNRARPEGSLLLSGAVLDVSHAKGSICSAPFLVRISFATDVTFVDSPIQQLSHEKNCSHVRDGQISLAPTPRKNPLADKLKITRIVKANDAGQGALVVVERNGVESIVRLGSEIADAQGKTFTDLAGWKLSFVADNFALFSKGHDDVGFRLERQR